MNKNQKIALLVGILAILLAGLFPPWTAKGQLTYRFAKMAAGKDLIQDNPSNYPQYFKVKKFRFFTCPPEPMYWDEPDPMTSKTSDSFTMDIISLYTEWLIIVVVVFVVMFEVLDKRQVKNANF
jgi:hypothetical protein